MPGDTVRKNDIVADGWRQISNPRPPCGERPQFCPAIAKIYYLHYIFRHITLLASVDKGQHACSLTLRFLFIASFLFFYTIFQVRILRIFYAPSIFAHKLPLHNKNSICGSSSVNSHMFYFCFVLISQIVKS